VYDWITRSSQDVETQVLLVRTALEAASLSLISILVARASVEVRSPPPKGIVRITVRSQIGVSINAKRTWGRSGGDVQSTPSLEFNLKGRTSVSVAESPSFTSRALQGAVERGW
jgi:hypothetical protein